MNTTEITSLDDEAIAAAVREWLTTTTLDNGATLGPWLVTDAWADWNYTPSELVSEVVGLTIGASSDMYDFEPSDLTLFSVTQDSEGERYTLNWIDSSFSFADDATVPTTITFTVDHYNDTTPDADSQSSDLAPITVDPADLGSAFEGAQVTTSPEVISSRVAVLVEQVTRVLAHLREHVLKLPITIAS